MTFTSRSSAFTLSCAGGSITADTALLLATYFRTSPETWLSLQSKYDLRVAGRATGYGSTGSGAQSFPM